MVSKTPFVECLEESAPPCGAMCFLWIKKKKRETDNILAVETVCGTVQYTIRCCSCCRWCVGQSWCLNRRFSGWVTGWATKELVPDCTDTSTTPKHRIRIAQSVLRLRYGLDGLGIESWEWRVFPHPSRPALGSTQPPIQWVTALSGG